MAKTYNKFQQFVEDVAHKVHDLENDQLKVALTSVAPVATNSVLADLTEIDYSDLSTRDITTSASAQTDGTYKLTLTDLTLTASGDVPEFRYVVIYNDEPTSPADPLIAWFDYGSNVDLYNGDTFTIDFDGTDGLLQIA
jgi:hypothetical protein